MRCWQAGIVASIVVGRLFHDRAASTWLSSGAENTQNRQDTDPSGSITRQAIWPGAVRLSFSDQLYIRLHLYMQHIQGKSRFFCSIPHQGIRARMHLHCGRHLDERWNHPFVWWTWATTILILIIPGCILDGSLTHQDTHIRLSLIQLMWKVQMWKVQMSMWVDVWLIWGALDCNWCCMDKVELKYRPWSKDLNKSKVSTDTHLRDISQLDSDHLITRIYVLG